MKWRLCSMSSKCRKLLCCLNTENEFIGVFFLPAFTYLNVGHVKINLCPDRLNLLHIALV